MQNSALIVSEEFEKQIKKFNKAMSKKYKTLSKLETPKYDGSGKQIVKHRDDGYDYIEERYMRFALDEYFPGWSWEVSNQQILGGEWVVTTGTLTIIDPFLIPLGINPPIRKFSGTDAARIMYKRGAAHSVDNIVDIGNNVKSSNSKALKVAINRFTHIGDDIYGKRVDEEGMGSETVVLESNPTGDVARNFLSDFIRNHKMQYKVVFEVLKVKNLTEVEDYADAIQKLKDYLDGGEKQTDSN